jgi:hypothetical protein
VNFALYSYRTRGTYAEQLAHYFRIFPREHVLVLDSDLVFAHEPAEMARLETFVGRTLSSAPPDNLQKNAGSYDAEPGSAEHQLRQFFTALDEPLAELVGRRFSWMAEAPGRA